MADRNRGREIDRKWEEIFEDYDILGEIEQNGLFSITAKEIKKYKEPRLMTKFDYESSLPDIFYENSINILPTTRGTYVLGNFNAYAKISNSKKDFINKKEVKFPSWIETINPDNITSEATMMNSAILSGMVSDLFNENDMFQTVSGRMSSDEFEFLIDGFNGVQNKISVKNSQIEVDSGIETANNLILFENKNNITDNFLVRQLYYPYKLWTGKVSKPVIPVYLQYVNGIYNFSIFKFNDLNDYSSIELVDRRNYIIGGESITLDEIVETIMSVKYIPEPNYKEIPFPQANTLQHIFDLLNAIHNSEESKITLEEATLLNNYVYRQAYYYSTAGIYLDLIQRNGDGTISLTPVAVEIMDKNIKQRNLALIQLIVRHQPFGIMAKESLKLGRPLTQNQAYELLKKYKLLNEYKPSTQHRRAGTIMAWIKTIFSMSDDF